MSTNIESLLDKIKKNPHWRVNFRPHTYKESLEDPAKLLDLIRQTSVMLRGWPFPYLSNDQLEIIREQNFVASGSIWEDLPEYWRLYNSGQFIDLFAVREKSRKEWDSKLRSETTHSVLQFMRDKNRSIPGFIEIVNLLYHFTEIFEFAARLSNKGFYKEVFDIVIDLRGIREFALTATWPKFWHGYYPATSENITKSWTVSPEEILTHSADLALEGAVHFLKRFGWDNPPVDILKQDQEKFLSGKI